MTHRTVTTVVVYAILGAAVGTLLACAIVTAIAVGRIADILGGRP